MKHPKNYNTDKITSDRMSKIKLTQGIAEMKLAKRLWNEGYRYRLNYRKLPGSPDIAVLKYRIAIFVDGEFWHGYEWDKRKQNLKRNREYWIEKIEENMMRDIKNDKALLLKGWIPIHFGYNDVMKKTEECVMAINEIIFENKIRNLSDDYDEFNM